MFNIFFPRTSCRLCDNVKEYSRAGQIIGDTAAPALCMLNNWGHTHTHTHTHTKYAILIVPFPPQQWLHKRSSVWRYAYIAYRVPFFVFQLTRSGTYVACDIQWRAPTVMYQILLLLVVFLQSVSYLTAVHEITITGATVDTKKW